MLVFIILTVVNRHISHGMNIGQHKEVIDKQVANRDQNTKERDLKINIERHIDIIDDVLEDLFENEEEGSTTENGQQTKEALKFFVSTKTKTLKTTVTSTKSVTSYHTCYKGKLI